MVSAITSLKMAESTPVSLKTASSTAMDLKKDFIKRVSGVKQMAWVNINLKETIMKDLKTATAKKSGLMAHSTLAIMLMAKKAGRAQEF